MQRWVTSIGLLHNDNAHSSSLWCPVVRVVLEDTAVACGTRCDVRQETSSKKVLQVLTMAFRSSGSARVRVAAVDPAGVAEALLFLRYTPVLAT